MMSWPSLMHQVSAVHVHVECSDHYKDCASSLGSQHLSFIVSTHSIFCIPTPPLGIEPILHGEVSSHMCSSISKSIAGIVVIYVWPFLPTDSDKKTDITICEIMVMTFVMCYVLIYTMMEPLRASIKAVYVCFAQNHQSLSQAFPILYHRLDRMSNERNMV